MVKFIKKSQQLVDFQDRGVTCSRSKNFCGIYKMQLGKNSIAFEEMPLTLKQDTKKSNYNNQTHQKPANWKCNAPRFCGYAFRKQQGSKTKIGVVEKSIESWHKS